MNGMNQIGAVVMLSRAMIFASGFVLSVAHATAAFAQAGSAGGTIGLRDKSVSGGGEAPSALHSAPRTKRTSSGTAPIRQRAFGNPTIAGIPLDRCPGLRSELRRTGRVRLVSGQGFQPCNFLGLEIRPADCRAFRTQVQFVVRGIHKNFL